MPTPEKGPERNALGAEAHYSCKLAGEEAEKEPELPHGALPLSSCSSAAPLCVSREASDDDQNDHPALLPLDLKRMQALWCSF